MIPSEQLKPFILSEKPQIRLQAVKYFDECFSQEEDLLPLVLDACDRYGDKECLTELAFSHHFSVSESSAVRIIEKIKTAHDINLNGHLNRLLGNCPLDFYQSHKVELQSMKNVKKDTLNRLERRILYSQKSPDLLWNKLKKISDAWNGHQPNQIPKSLHNDLKSIERDNFNVLTSDILDALSSAPVPEPSEVIRLLNDPKTVQTYLEVILVELIGRQKIMEGIPILVNILESEDFDLPEDTMKALRRIHNSIVVQSLLKKYPTGKEYAPNYIVSLLGDIKLPESEDALLEILQTETDIERRTSACASLCNLFSERGLPIVIQQVLDGYYNMLTDLCEDAEITAEILGVEIPQTEAWLQAKEREKSAVEQRKMEWQKAFGALSREMLEPKPQPTGLLAQKPIFPDTKIGRNDPCPSGSGKKYKKCCGKNT